MGAGDEINSAATENFNNTTFWAIKVPKGSKALSIPAPYGPGESEVLLPRDTPLRINAIRKVPQVDADTLEENGRFNYFVDAEVVPNPVETRENPGAGGIIGRDKLGNPIYDNTKTEKK
jgi:hypothetical protein